jgi:hypothetical protein
MLFPLLGMLFPLPGAYVIVWIMNMREADVMNASQISNLS